MADRHAGWSWTSLGHFVLYLHEPALQAIRGVLSGRSRRLRVRARDQLILQILDRHPGTTFRAVAGIAGISATQVMRVVRREAVDFWEEIRSRFRTCADRDGCAASRRSLGRYRRQFRKPAEQAAGRAQRKQDRALAAIEDRRRQAQEREKAEPDPQLDLLRAATEARPGEA